MNWDCVWIVLVAALIALYAGMRMARGTGR